MILNCLFNVFHHIFLLFLSSKGTAERMCASTLLCFCVRCRLCARNFQAKFLFFVYFCLSISLQFTAKRSIWALPHHPHLQVGFWGLSRHAPPCGGASRSVEAARPTPSPPSPPEDLPPPLPAASPAQRVDAGAQILCSNAQIRLIIHATSLHVDIVTGLASSI